MRSEHLQPVKLGSVKISINGHPGAIRCAGEGASWSPGAFWPLDQACNASL